VTSAGIGHAVFLDTCDGRSAQRFDLLIGSATVVIRSAGGCLQKLGTGADQGAPAGLVVCDSSEAQQWFWTSGTYLWSAATEMCLDIPRLDNEPGVKLDLWECNGGDNQMYGFRP
jgi:chitinase